MAVSRSLRESARPALLDASGVKLLDFSTKPNTTVTIRLITHVYNAGGAAALLDTGSGNFGRHAQRGFDARSNLKRRGGGKKEASARYIQSFGKVLGIVGNDAHGAKTQWRSGIEPGHLSAFCRRFQN